ncbi:MAG: hypothetical protein KJP03_03240 [Gammaproteobacteria bacterium]|nr:hypothetical protein [Gammaproteobacteria bacterium]
MTSAENNSLNWVRYGCWYLGTLAVLLLLVAAVNFVVDPLGRWRVIDEVGFNKFKVAAKRDSRVGKAVSLRECDYDVVLLGSSRVESGLNPTYAGLPGRAYNSGLKAATIYELERLGLYALKHQSPSLMIIGLDFFAFNEQRVTYDDFGISPLPERLQIWPLFRYLVSLENLYNSYQTVFWNSRRNAQECAYNGFRKNRPRRLPISEEFSKLVEDFLSNPDMYGDYLQTDAYPNRMRDLMIELRSAGVDVRPFISPMHVVLLEAIGRQGIDDKFSDWKREMVRIVVEANAATPSLPPMQLWDFSGYNTITTEPVPDDDADMYGYRDPSHYRQHIGVMMIDKMLGLPPSGEEPPADFGVVLTPENLAEQLEKQSAGRARHDFSRFLP